MNKGGSQDIAGLRVTMTDARHSSGFVDNGQMVYMGEPAGYVVRLEDGRVDLLRRRHVRCSATCGSSVRCTRRRSRSCRSAIASRWIPAAAARACEFLGVRQVVPMHWGTFPMLTGRPADLRRLVEPRGVQVLELKPGETAE